MASKLDKGSISESVKSEGSYTPSIPFTSSVPFTGERYEAAVPFTPDIPYPTGSTYVVSDKTESL